MYTIPIMGSNQIINELDNRIIDDFYNSRVVAALREEENLRKQYPALQDAWEDYQVTLRLVKAGQLVL